MRGKYVEHQRIKECKDYDREDKTSTEPQAVIHVWRRPKIILTFVSDGNVSDLKHEKVTKAVGEFVETMRGLGLNDEEIEAELSAYLKERN